MNKNKQLIFILGKTSSAKDTIARYIKDEYDVEAICSYSTRPMRDYEVDGFHHYFITEGMMSELKKRNDLIAYTKFPKTGYEYCATVEGMSQDVMVYIINPEGLKWFKENGTKNIKTITIYVDLDEAIIRQRALERGDNPEDIEKRLDSEREEFNTFKASGDYDYLINTNKTFQEVYDEVDEIMRKIMI